MDDVIYRRDAINVVDAVWSVTGDKNVAKVWDQIKDLPSAQPETHGKRTETHACDLIDRQAAIDALGDEPEVWTGKDEYAQGLNNQWHYDKNAILAVPSAQPEQRWIPVTKKLPEYDKPVLLSTAWGKTEIGFWTQCGWMIVACSYREFEQSAVTAWMPLPEPYVERKQDADND